MHVIYTNNERYDRIIPSYYPNAQTFSLRAIEKLELKYAFKHCGTITDVWLAFNPPGFGFLEFETPEEAQKAVTLMNRASTDFSDSLKVEITAKRQRGFHLYNIRKICQYDIMLIYYFAILCLYILCYYVYVIILHVNCIH